MTVLIVGAGLAGLAAAQRLVQKGRKTIIIEARNRVGGRVFTQRDEKLALPIELGAEWYEKRGPVEKLLRKAGAESTEVEGHRLESRDESFEDLDDRFDNTEKLLRRIRLPDQTDMTLDEAFTRFSDNPEFARSRAMFSKYVEGFHAAATNRISIRWLQEVERKHPASSSDQRSADGLDTAINSLLDATRSASEIQLSATAREVRWSRGRVDIRVDGRDTPLSGDAAIFTLPVSLWKSEDNPLRFVPPLSGKKATAFLEMGHATKMVLRFRTPFWRRNPEVRDASFLHAFGQPFPTWWMAENPEVPLLTAWAGGPQATRLGTTRTDALLELAVTSLANLFHTSRAEIEQELEAHYHHDWNEDPFSRGAYTYVAAGGIDAHKELALPVDDTLFFAGEATCGEGQNATMEGAVLSGWRAADEVVERVVIEV